MPTSILFVTLLWFGGAMSSARADGCQDRLAANGPVRPTKKTLRVGAILEVKSKLIGFEQNSNRRYVTLPVKVIKAYWPEIPYFATKTFPLEPGQRLRTLTPVKRHFESWIVRVELIPDGHHAVMY